MQVNPSVPAKTVPEFIAYAKANRLCADIAAGTGPVLDDELLTEPLRQPLADQARRDVGRAGRRLPRRDFLHLAAGAAALPAMSRIVH
jgi:hypothetical protein